MVLTQISWMPVATQPSTVLSLVRISPFQQSCFHTMLTLKQETGYGSTNFIFLSTSGCGFWCTCILFIILCMLSTMHRALLPGKPHQRLEKGGSHRKGRARSPRHPWPQKEQLPLRRKGSASTHSLGQHVTFRRWMQKSAFQSGPPWALRTVWFAVRGQPFQVGPVFPVCSPPLRSSHTQVTDFASWKHLGIDNSSWTVSSDRNLKIVMPVYINL